MVSGKHEIICPCCETKLQIDAKTGEVIWQEKKVKDFGSMSDMVKGLDNQRKEQASLFQKQSEIQKDRKRIRTNETNEHVMMNE